MKRYFTIGMAGHIDHGKTSLTKALTNVDTDRLKEEKERQISIEPGFAPLYEDDDVQISVVDVPGHERFIRQMIAGVAGIDLVVLVVAADEGVMPQTREHLDILGFLGIESGIIAITKIDRVEEEFIELVKDDILAELEGSVFQDAPFLLVDSIKKKGTEELKQTIVTMLKSREMRDFRGAFRLPVDQVFTVKGQGTVVRGTVFEGSVEEGKMLRVMPRNLEVKARQLQVHHKAANIAFAGQRVAINIAGASKEELKRGDVLVSSDRFIVTRTIDVAIVTAGDLEYLVKQRTPVKCHIGTAEVMGRIVFFDRNELKENTEEILCQLRLDEEIVTKRGDRFIIRRPSPQETIGGGWVIDPRGNKYRYGEKTIKELQKKKVGTPPERIAAALFEGKILSLAQLSKRTALDEGILKDYLGSETIVKVNSKEFTIRSLVDAMKDDLEDRLDEFHRHNPMRKGVNKAELLQPLQEMFPRTLLEFVLEEGLSEGLFNREGQFVKLLSFQPHVPKNWEKRTEGMLTALQHDGLHVRYLSDYIKDAGIPEHIAGELKKFLEESRMIVPLDQQYYWHSELFDSTVEKLNRGTGTEFEVGDAKAILGLSRKYLIPLLERLDSLNYTKRAGNKRIWLPNPLRR
ncbi:selenocysteine-specific translation elongation factor [Bacillus massilinigeriensis]|uniref:selenocysteine-specific translation elongation factor n=1 Tax=Bacillus mediterraneensis TaxID=1805474 RepID=UPI00093EB6D1|nr:selenocysteine-specific translation elongation factor [Bacillus mediterraneensis]